MDIPSWRNFVASLVVLAVCTGLIFAQSPGKSAGTSAELLRAREFVRTLVQEQGIPGLSVAVAVKGKIVWSEALGFADLESRVPATPQTRYRVGSISKLFTAAAAARLHQLKLLDLDAPVQKYVVSFPQKEYLVTSRDLLGHLAGIRHYGRADYINQKNYPSVTESLSIFKDDPLLHQPRSKYLYSSYGYVLMSAVIEGAAKRDFADYLRSEVFGPLGMKGTVPDDVRKIIAYRSGFYAKGRDGALNNDIYMDTSDRLAAGGFLSTAEDLARFGAAMLNSDILNRESRNLLFTSMKTADGKPTEVGSSWRIGKDAESRTIYHHGGASVGGRAFLLLYPDSWVVVAITSNLSFAEIAETEAARIADHFLKTSDLN